MCQWKPSCKAGSAKWCYDGVCTDPLVFGTLLRLDGPPKWKMHKIPVAEFNNMLGHIQGSARSIRSYQASAQYPTLTTHRYSNLYITGSHVNVRWSDSGEFKFSGTYGT